MNLQLGRGLAGAARLAAHTVIRGHLKAGVDLLAGGWSYLKAHSHVWHLTLPVAGTLSWSDQPTPARGLSMQLLPFSQRGGWVPRASVPRARQKTHGISMTWPQMSVTTILFWSR